MNVKQKRFRLSNNLSAQYVLTYISIYFIGRAILFVVCLQYTFSFLVSGGYVTLSLSKGGKTESHLFSQSSTGSD